MSCHEVFFSTEVANTLKFLGCLIGLRTKSTNNSRSFENNLFNHRSLPFSYHLVIFFLFYWSCKFQRSDYLSRVDHVQKIKDRKERMGMGKFSFVNRIIKTLNQLPAEVLGTCLCKPKIFRNRVRKAIINWVKWKERSVSEII